MKTKMNHARCQDCQFWVPHKREERKGEGECHRHAPQIVSTTYSSTAGDYGAYREEVNSSIESQWPDTKSEDWCGDFQRDTGT